ncbi:unnamed protein product [Paramecium primaurelia]|uniref:Uncharacterized protein n=1 Tax=Paramecium primaurelia TaxID=5886 RepID=A0A8S1P017_PARPR|nr:unnamed protein product [Paramecium primaurelia]
MAETHQQKKIQVLIAASGRIQKEYQQYKNEIKLFENIIQGIENNEQNESYIKKYHVAQYIFKIGRKQLKLIDLLAESGQINEQLKEEALQCIDQAQLFLNFINPVMI